MAKFKHGWIGMAVALCCAPLAAANELQTPYGFAQSLIVEGEYQSASHAAASANTADSFALAAEALLSEVMLGLATDNKDQAKDARDLAEAALKLQPDHQNARLQYAIADGFITRETGNVSAWMKKLPQKTYAIVQDYRADFPDDARGDALLGAWHLAVVSKAGEKNAQKWFGASVADGQLLYNAALSKDANNVIVNVNYAFALLALSDEDMADTQTAKIWLEQSVQLDPSDHMSQTLLGYARTVLDMIDNRDAARIYAAMFLDGKKPIVLVQPYAAGN
ncbi:hypothetical protein ACJ3XI_00720 [Litorimonas sp. RW-G-Af-16]|uniref:hypothetical protein n=1 Tax=Litorimonas sp. RW-G-Af-16 TaxID=3241168 RepID=UPI00390C7911